MRVEDESGDRKYFTIIPNYILNHSTLWDREVYIQMKRIAGEDGTCWTSVPKLAKQCGISKNRLRKSIKYLLEHKWIVLRGEKKVASQGGLQGVNEYAVADLWDMNNTFYQEKYKGGSPEVPPLSKGGSPKEQRGFTAEAKGGSPEGHEEEPLLNKNPLIRERANTPTPSQKAGDFFNKPESQLEVMIWLEEKGVPQNIAQREITKFVSYWTELNKSGTKQRWQLQQTFEVQRRLTTWFNKINEFQRPGRHIGGIKV